MKDNPQKRRYSLYALGVFTTTLYLYRQDKNLQQEKNLEKLLFPVIKSLNDKDIKVQLAACDVMYNIV